MKKFFMLITPVLLAVCLALFAACTDGEETGGNNSANVGGQQSGEEQMVENIYFTVNGNKIAVAPENNAAARALAGLLKEGDITYTADDYGGFEKVGSLGRSLPHSDSQITAKAGDVMLYSGNQIVIFYGSNSWAYTKLGKITGYSAEELKTLLAAGEGSITITISLN